MTSIASFRRWLHQAPATERAMTAAVTVVVMALLAWALVPAPTKVTDTGVDLGVASGEGSALDVAAALPEDAGVGQTGVVSAAGSGPTASGGAKGKASTAASPRGAAATDAGAPGGTTGRLTATDRGVTADAIKLGFAEVGFGAAAGLGFKRELRGDSSKAIDALVDYANKRGGVLGRRIQPVKVNPDLILADDQRQKCVQLTETHGVFAVVDSFAFAFEASTSCITAEHKTLLINGNPGASQNVRLGFPYHVSVRKDDNRKMRDLATAAKAAGFFDPAKGFRKLGIFGDACSDSVYDAPTDGLKAHLRAVGVTEWSFFRANCAEAGSGPPADAVLQFKQDGVTHVLLAARPPIVEGYLNAAGSATYYPKYFTSDYFNLILGIFSDKYEPVGFDGALGVTETHAGEGAIGKPLPPLAATCSKIFTDHGLPPVSSAPPLDMGRDLEVLELCESFLLFLQVATAAGPNLTRTTWVNALAGIGDFRPATTDLARFDRRGKMTGGDTMKLVKWHRDCKCWKELAGFGPAAG